MARIATFLLLITAFSCQFKGEEEAGALISGNQEVTNKFTVSMPTSATYTLGEDLDYTLEFPYSVTVTGMPRLSITVGNTSRYANYVSGTGTSSLLFRYTVQAADLDTNGVAVSSSLGLNGGTLTYTGTNGLDDCSTSMSVPSYAGVKVDTVSPTISSVSGPTAATYYLGQHLNFIATWDEKVTVTGSPQLDLTIGATARAATYVSGSGSKSLLFRYTVVAADLDTNGITVAAAMSIPGGATVRDSAGNNATLTFTAPNTASVNANGNTPYVTVVTPPANGTYGLSDNLDFIFTYSEAVIVTGTPTLTLTVGSTTRLASYYSGSGSTQLTFRYVVQTGEVDTNGIAAGSLFNLSGATIRDSGATNALNSFTMPSLTAVKVADNRPVISSFLVNNATYYIGQTFSFTALFSEAVTVTGTPRIPIALNSGGPVYATYASGSGSTNIVFSYTITDGTDDNNGVVITTPAELNGGTIKNSGGTDANLSFTQPSTPNLRVSGIRPTVTSVTAPANGSYSTGQNLDFIVNFSENVTAGSTANIKLNLTVGASSAQASYLSGSGTSALTFRYTVTGGDSDIDGIAVGTLALAGAAYITDGTSTNNLATTTFTPPDTSSILVNATTPVISSVPPPADGAYILAQNMDFTVNYSETVNVTGSPRLTLTVGSSTLYATYASGSGSPNLVFRYTIATGNLDTDGVTLSTSIDNNGGSISSALGVSAATGLSSPNLTAVLVDGIAPSISSVTPPSNGIYTSSSVSMSFTITWNDTVTVSGTPRIVLTVGHTTRYANYASGSGTTSLVFTYLINVADLDLDGLALNSSSIDLNGGSLLDASGNAASVSLGSLDLSGILVNFTGMLSWWDVDKASSVSTSVCGIAYCATQISDRNGGTVHATASGSARPEYRSSGFGGGNRGALVFDNTAMVMGTSAGLNPLRTVFIVFQTEVATMTTQDIFYQSGLTPRVQIASGGNLSLGVVGTYTLNGSALSASASTHAAGFTANTSYILGVQYGGGYNFSAPGLGATNFGGKISEVLVYSSALSAANVAAIVQYLNDKHQIY